MLLLRVFTEDEVCGCRPSTFLRLFYYSTFLFRAASAFQVNGTQRQQYNFRDTETNKGLMRLLPLERGGRTAVFW